MLIFNCTKAASDFFTAIRKGNKLSPMSPTPKCELSEELVLHDHQQWHWMVHVKKFGHRNVILAMDTDSRFCMLFWGLKKGNIQKFLEQFHNRFSLHIIAFINMGGQDETLLNASMELFLKNHHEYAFVPRGDRSVQAHINDALMNLQYEQYRWEDDIPTEEELFISDLRHNDTPRKRKQDKDYIFPTEILFSTWLSHYANLDEQTIKHTFSKYRQTNSQLWKFPFDIDVGDLNFNEIEAVIAEALSDNVLSFEDYFKQKNCK
ncbi:TPA: hypothetical protein F8R96_16355 [Legionella pneumophila]|nr:hypothetical protein [Legionella pneumophila]HAU1322476.1 hypothetical protein [Legionella pneumophila]HBC0468910.1 hypothetical protein [Legionella pneumophila]HBD9376022.1 hypothetical protein [Legionella pneumophila]HBI2948110.1 hypothetical protein [Legionella pneumophila]